MHGHDEGAELLLVEILKLVNEQSDRNPTLVGGFGNGDQQIRQVAFQIAAVSRAFFGVYVQADFDLPHFHLQAAHEALEHCQRAFGFVSGTGDAVEFKEEFA